LSGKFIGIEKSKTQERDVEIKELRGLKKQRRQTFQQQILDQCCQLLAPLSGQSRAEIRLQRIKIATMDLKVLECIVVLS
jgi:hypothetical protein